MAVLKLERQGSKQGLVRSKTAKGGGLWGGEKGEKH